MKDKEMPIVGFDQPLKWRDPMEAVDQVESAEKIQSVKLLVEQQRSTICYWESEVDKLCQEIKEIKRDSPHTFVGRTDRDCELCGKSDRDEIHIASHEMLRNRIKLEVEEEREACAKTCERILDEKDVTITARMACRFNAIQIRARKSQ